LQDGGGQLFEEGGTANYGFVLEVELLLLLLLLMTLLLLLLFAVPLRQ
jgi:hypothetical protein